MRRCCLGPVQEEDCVMWCRVQDDDDQGYHFRFCVGGYVEDSDLVQFRSTAAMMMARPGWFGFAVLGLLVSGLVVG